MHERVEALACEDRVIVQFASQLQTLARARKRRKESPPHVSDKTGRHSRQASRSPLRSIKGRLKGWRTLAQPKDAYTARCQVNCGKKQRANGRNGVQH